LEGYKVEWFYFYIFPHQLPEFEAKGWVMIGNMRPDDWASPNKGNIIVRKSIVNIPEEIELNQNTRIK
jgi:hypothetical protein